MIPTIEYYENIPSTSDRVKELLQQPVKPALPCLVVAGSQTAGRGRGNKRWWSGKGAILMSIGIELSSDFLTRDQLPTYSATVAWSIIKVLQRYLPHHSVEFKLPNDILVDGKKICGILLESPTPQYVILGIGLNVNNRLCDIPDEFLQTLPAQPMTSMIDLLGIQTDIICLRDELLAELPGGFSL